MLNSTGLFEVVENESISAVLSVSFELVLMLLSVLHHSRAQNDTITMFQFVVIY